MAGVPPVLFLALYAGKSVRPCATGSARRAGRSGRTTRRARGYDPPMLANLTPFLLHWAITAFGLWVAAHVFKGMRFDSGGALALAALLLGLANAVVRPLLVVLTLPLTLLTFGLFLLVINALMLMLVARLVRGFHLDGFWTAFWASLFMSLLSLVLGAFVLGGTPEFTIETSPPPGQTWL